MADTTKMVPAGKKVAAQPEGMDNAHIAGYRLAERFYKEAKDRAETIVKEGMSMKGKLTEMTKLTVEERNTFFATMGEHKAEIEKEAKAANFDKLTDYFKSGGKPGAVAYSVYTEISMWNKMCYALAAGWAPAADYIKKTNWQALSKEATEFKNKATANPNAAPKSETEKQAEKVQAMQRAVKSVARAATAALVEGEGDDAKLTEVGKSALPDVVAQIMTFASVAEFDAVISRLQSMRDAVAKATEAAAKATAKAAKTSAETPTQPTGNVGREVTPERANAVAKEVEADRKPSRSRKQAA